MEFDSAIPGDNALLSCLLFNVPMCTSSLLHVATSSTSGACNKQGFF